MDRHRRPADRFAAARRRDRFDFTAICAGPRNSRTMSDRLAFPPSSCRTCRSSWRRTTGTAVHCAGRQFYDRNVGSLWRAPAYEVYARAVVLEFSARGAASPGIHATTCRSTIQSLARNTVTIASNPARVTPREDPRSSRPAARAVHPLSAFRPQQRRQQLDCRCVSAPSLAVDPRMADHGGARALPRHFGPRGCREDTHGRRSRQPRRQSAAAGAPVGAAPRPTIDAARYRRCPTRHGGLSRDRSLHSQYETRCWRRCSRSSAASSMTS